MKEKSRVALIKFVKAYQRLQEAARNQSDQFYVEAIVKRFEFTFELIWKALKMLLEEEGGCNELAKAVS
jgi:hypothetical protein